MALPLAALLVLAGLLGACEDDAPIVPAAPQAGSSGVGVITPAAITTEFADLNVDIPAGVVSVAIIVRGTNTNLKFLDHGKLVQDSSSNFSFFITGPDGQAPLSFNQRDDDGVDVGVFTDVLLNFQAEALFFPNNGDTALFTGGSWTFPIGSLNAAGNNFEVDTLQPYVLYKTSAGTGQTMDVNLFVVSGVKSGITSKAAALADPEISGAITVLENVYRDNGLLGLTLNVNVEIVADTNFISIDTESEQDLLLRSFPSSLASDALNLFIVGSLAYLPSGVIGLSAGIPGPFQLHGTIVSGTLAEYQSDGTGTILGFTLAHEFGHYLGLWHTSQTSGSTIVAHDPLADTPSCTTADFVGAGCPDETNLMFPFVSNNVNPPISARQAQVILNNPAIYP